MIVVYYFIVFAFCYLGLCLYIPPENGEELLALAPVAGLCVLIIALIHILGWIIYTMTPSGNKALEESIERSLGGLPFLYLSGLNSIEEDSMVLIVIVANQLVIKKDSSTILKTIELNEIKSIKPLSESTITEKEKSVIGRAIVGGLIFGVVGAVVGGMSGMDTKKEMKTEHFIKITLNDGTEILLAPFMNNPGNTKYLTDKFDEYLKQ